ncbi:E3 ubiquitin-protein ligase TRIM71 [Phytophthora citrophthora]|uniref:E3 ubiquitin-protein ligase TRIM71 n=1 Tax=Phytophthora citrophthora TaxID=4793 RepID=A0AAD9GZE1_9STRA|nr:E3 ubiquitin-protein ligase TRIM71 [Phytophthora citrophthora]
MMRTSSLISGAYRLENQRLEEAARQRQEDLRRKQEAECKRLEDERIAEEQRHLQEREEIRRKKKAEEDRITNREHEEQMMISNIEKQLKLVGAFWTSTLQLPGRDEGALPISAAVVAVKALEKPIVGLEDDVVLIGDTTAKIHGFDLKTKKLMFTSSWSDGNVGSIPVRMPLAMATTRCGRLLVCEQMCARIAIIDLHVLFQLFFAQVVVGQTCNLDASTARAGYMDGSPHLSLPQGLAVDDAAGEFYASDEASNCVRVYKLPTRIATKRLALERSISSSREVVLKRPTGLSLSHYHVVICDTGYSRLAVFAKRGAFVQTFGQKGMNGGEFYDLRDVKLANIRKRAITRGIEPERDAGVSNEQFEAIVADCGNFRVQILNERGEFLRQLSLLGSLEQVSFQRDKFATLRAELAREYAALRHSPPVLAGESMNGIYSLATLLHPMCKLYSSITTWQMRWRGMRSRFHHPFTLAYAPTDREIVVVDRENASVYTYNFDAAGCNWLQLLKNQLGGICSVHSCLQLTFSNSEGVKDSPQKRWLYVSDPVAHRVAVIDSSNLSSQFFIGATTYGDRELCSNGFLPGELNRPTFIATYTVDDGNTVLAVSDSGNHSVSLFNARSGSFRGRIGEGFGHLEGFLDSPQGVAVWKNEFLYVCDQCNHRVQVFNVVTRKFVHAFGRLGTSPGEFNFPTGIALCPALPTAPKCNFGLHRSDKICIADTGNCRVQVLDLNGSVQLVFDGKTTPFDQPLSPVGIWIQQRSGYILVGDIANRCVAIFTNAGVFLSAFGATGEVDTRFVQPMTVAIAPHYAGVDLLLVADASRCDVSTFQLRS